MNKQKCFWIVAAGTGGHIFPGLRIAEALEKKSPDLQFLFFGSQQRLESEIVPKHGRRIFFLKASPWKGKGVLSRVVALFDLALGFFQAVKFSFQEPPMALLSVGGYVSLPVALAVFFRRRKIFLIEPNIRAGISNRLVSKLACRAFTTPGSDATKVFSCPVHDFGNPVRSGFQACPIRSSVQRVLVLGGSQGAKALCEATLRAAAKLDFKARQIHVLIQSGAAHFTFAQALANELGLTSHVEIRAFVDQVDEELKESDLVVARAGAMTVAELSIAALPTIFIPFPFAADDHQRVNAKLLEDAGAAKCVDEREADFQASLETEIGLLIADEKLRRSRSENLQKWGRPEATEAISRAIMSELNR